MRLNKILAVGCFAWLLASAATGQKTTVYRDAQLEFKRANDFFEQSLYGQAQEAYAKVLQQTVTPTKNKTLEIQQLAELRVAQCAIRLGQPEAEKLMLEFIRRNASSRIANFAQLEAGNYYFSTGDSKKALEYYEKVNEQGLTNNEVLILRFRRGYTYFVDKQYKKAQPDLASVKDVTENTYYNAANYYYGITKFLDDKYDEAITSFKRIENTPDYQDVVPYYICQIMFAQNKINEVISYGEAQLKRGSAVKNNREISQLVGQAYFIQKQYAKALPLLEEFVNNAGSLRKEDLYQLAFTQYQMNKYAAAIKNFEELTTLNSALGQNALYNMADCHLKTNDKRSARNAFKGASNLDFDKDLKAEAQFNYAKLCVELNDDKEAINALQNVGSVSKNYNEAQELLSRVFLNTRNYEDALKTIERIPEKSVKLKEAYQKVAYSRGVQLYNDGKIPEAKALFSKSLTYPIDPLTKAMAYYWVGEINHNTKDYDASISDFNQFLTISKTITGLPDESSVHTANYAQGYNHLKKGSYEMASRYFYAAATGIKENAAAIRNAYVKEQVLPDALLRNGDCYFKENKYAEAIANYDQVINAKSDGSDYALFQKAVILGLQEKAIEKIIALEELVSNKPNSAYADDALFALGSTYFEIGKATEATQNLKQLVANYKGKSDLINSALLKLGLVAFNQGQLDAALDYYKQVLSNNPDAREAKSALNSIQEIYIKKGDPDKYFEFLENLSGYKVSDNAKDSVSYRTAETQYRAGKYDLAVQSYTKYIKQFPKGQNILPALFERGESYYILKDYANAIADYEAIIAKGNSSYFNRSLRKAALIAYNFSQDFAKAYNYFNQLLTITTDPDELYQSELYTLRSAFRIKNEQGVYTTAQRVMDSPKSGAKDDAEAQYYIGKTALTANQLDKSNTAFTSVMSLIDNIWAAEALYQTAYIQYLKRDLRKAESIALQSSSKYPNYDYWVAKSIILVADIYAEQGNNFNAKASLQSIIENYEGNDDIIPTAKEKLAKLEAASGKSSRINNANGSSGKVIMDGN